MTTPNVIIILADDLGYSDVAPYGGEIDTPSLQRLADRGVRMSSYYTTPRCSPSRAALLTGRQPHSVGVGVLTTNDAPDGYPGSLSVNAPTLAERLGELGYVTGLFGKWHLSSDVSTPNSTWPTRRGFDEFHGILPGASSYYQPPLMEGEEPVAASDVPADYYFTDDVSERGAEFVRRHAGAETPFFLYLAYTAPHWPLHASEQDIAKYRERYAAGWSRTRQQRLERLARSGLVDRPGQGLGQEPDLAPWPEDLGEWQTERMATYAAQVEALDRGIGRVLDSLDDSDAAEDTIVIFFSDNGGCSEELPPELAAAFLSSTICPRTTPSGEPVRIGNDPEVMPGPADTYASYGEDWATVSNTPFRKWKRWVHEGGIASPLLVSWPGGGVPAGGAVAHAVAHVTDLVPTVMDACGVPVDTGGRSLVDVWRRPDTTWDDRTLCWEHIGNSAVRRGRWKVVREWGGPWELYDLAVDRGETVDRAAQQPELVADLLEEYHRWARDNGVIPWEDVLASYRARGKPEEHAIG